MGNYIPNRKCVGCRSIKKKNDLIRVVKNQAGVFIDYKNNIVGRGAYICKDINCLHEAVRKKLLERSLKTQIPQEIYNHLEILIESFLNKTTEVS